MLAAIALLLGLAIAATSESVIVIPGTLAAPAGSAYPRALQLPGSSMQLVCVGQTHSGIRSLVVFARNATEANSTWSRLGTVVSAPTQGEDLANCNLAPGLPPKDASTSLGCDPQPAHALDAVLSPENANLRVFATYRHHLGCEAGSGCEKYRIAASTSLDGAATWSPTSILTTTSPPDGVWEPFGFWGPDAASNAPTTLQNAPTIEQRELLAASLPPCVLRVAYSLEYMGVDPHTNISQHEQLIAAQDSSDLGVTWGAVDTLLSTPGSRNGMPGLARIASDGTWLLVMEGFWSEAGWGRFTVNLARSTDGARSFSPMGVVYAPIGSDGSLRNAGAPQIVACPDAKSPFALVSMMTNDASASTHAAWPADAFVKVSLIDMSASKPLPSSPIAQFGGSNNLFWPGLSTLSIPGNGSLSIAALWGDPSTGSLIGGLSSNLCPH